MQTSQRVHGRKTVRKSHWTQQSVVLQKQPFQGGGKRRSQMTQEEKANGRGQEGTPSTAAFLPFETSKSKWQGWDMGAWEGIMKEVGGTLHNALVRGKEAMKDTGVRGNHFLSKIIDEGKRNRLKGLGKCLRQKKDGEGFYIKILGWF